MAVPAGSGTGETAPASLRGFEMPLDAHLMGVVMDILAEMQWKCPQTQWLVSWLIGGDDRNV